MNTNFLAIIKRITAEQGEGILADPARLKGYVSDYAKNEPKEERVAFGRAIEQGFYRELKRAAPQGRAQVKAALASRLQTVTGFDAIRCAAAVDLLEAAITPAAAMPPHSAATTGAPASPALPRITKRTLIFGAAAGAGAAAMTLPAPNFASLSPRVWRLPS